mgnify:CR=1 FL=1
MDLQEKVIELAKSLQDYKAADVVVLDLTKKNTFTDYFVIATAGSATHAGGLEKQVSEKAGKGQYQYTLYVIDIGHDD